MAIAQLREGIRPGSGLWFYDCGACPCAFGTMGSREKAEQEGRAHDAVYHEGRGGITDAAYPPPEKAWGARSEDVA
jgi:hypothetical protein